MARESSNRAPEGEFRSEIDRLAAQAREESRRSQSEAQRAAIGGRPKRRIHPIVWVGLVLVLIEAGLLVAQYTIPRANLSEGPAPAWDAVRAEHTCRGEIVRTYSAVVAHIREVGRPPETLGALVGTRLTRLPVDPATQKPLRYEVRGNGFILNCPSKVS